MFTAWRKLGPCSRSAVYRTLGTRKRSSTVTATTTSRLKGGLCDNGANPVINIYSPPSSVTLLSSTLFRVHCWKHSTCESIKHLSTMSLKPLDIFQQENTATKGMEITFQEVSRRKETPIFSKPSALRSRRSRASVAIEVNWVVRNEVSAASVEKF